MYAPKEDPNKFYCQKCRAHNLLSEAYTMHLMNKVVTIATKRKTVSVGIKVCKECYEKND